MAHNIAGNIVIDAVNKMGDAYSSSEQIDIGMTGSGKLTVKNGVLASSSIDNISIGKNTVLPANCMIEKRTLFTNKLYYYCDVEGNILKSFEATANSANVPI